jgi:two-component system, sensor histidine kinase ChiS
MNILIIEDDKVSLKMLQHSIDNLGHTVHTAENSEAAISLLSTEKIDLILSDIMMPGISGLSLVSVLRTVQLCKLPIIMMSVLHNQALLDAAFEAGANDFLVKPISIELLKDKLEKYEKNVKA